MNISLAKLDRIISAPRHLFLTIIPPLSVALQPTLSLSLSPSLSLRQLNHPHVLAG